MDGAEMKRLLEEPPDAFGLRGLNPSSQRLYLGFRVWGLGFRVWGLEFGVGV